MNMTQLANQKYGTHFWNQFYYRLGKNLPLRTLTRNTLTPATITHYGFLKFKGIIAEQINYYSRKLQGGSNMTGTDLCVRLYKSVPVIFEPSCTWSTTNRRNGKTRKYKPRNEHNIIMRNKYN